MRNTPLTPSSRGTPEIFKFYRHEFCRRYSSRGDIFEIVEGVPIGLLDDQVRMNKFAERDDLILFYSDGVEASTVRITSMVTSCRDTAGRIRQNSPILSTFFHL